MSLAVQARLILFTMKLIRIAILLSAMCLSTGLGAQNFVYTDAAELPLYGKISEETNTRYERLPSRLEGISRKEVWKRGRCSSGLYVRFRSDASAIGVKWQSTFDAEQNHMTDTGTRGLDLYAFVDGEWKAVAPARPAKRRSTMCPLKICWDMTERLLSTAAISQTLAICVMSRTSCLHSRRR